MQRYLQCMAFNYYLFPPEYIVLKLLLSSNRNYGRPPQRCQHIINFNEQHTKALFLLFFFFYISSEAFEIKSEVQKMAQITIRLNQKRERKKTFRNFFVLLCFTCQTKALSETKITQRSVQFQAIILSNIIFFSFYLFSRGVKKNLSCQLPALICTQHRNKNFLYQQLITQQQ